MAVISPIYKDTCYIFTGSTLEYKVQLDGATIFNGRAYAAPGQDTISINVNRVCENYLNNYDITPILTEETGTTAALEAFREFLLIDSSDDSTLETYRFLYNYDYDGEFNAAGMALSDPITNKTATNMLPLRTYFTGQQVNNMLDGTFYPESVCGAEYALYYLNARGGWDAFVIEGSSQKTDKISRHQYNKSYNNQTLEYERNTYISEIESAWKLNTGILDDEQARKLCWHLLASNRVYLHDLKADKIVPVVITNTQNIYNTYKNNDHQPIQYEIDLVESQTKLRQ